jgi:hypothetical protein
MDYWGRSSIVTEYREWVKEAERHCRPESSSCIGPLPEAPISRILLRRKRECCNSWNRRAAVFSNCLKSLGIPVRGIGIVR